MSSGSVLERPRRRQSPSDSFQVSPRFSSIQSGLRSRMSERALAIDRTGALEDKPLLESLPVELT